MIVHKSTTGLYRPLWTVWTQNRGIDRRRSAVFGPERFIAEGKLEIGKLRGGGRIS